MPKLVDKLLAAVGLLVLSPILLAFAIWIKLDSRGPVLYRQRRVGKDGRVFEMLKLRTMKEGSDPVGVGTVVGRADPRVTRPGELMRRTSIDEIPNLVNVLRGDMALVGPRPALPAHLDHFDLHGHPRFAVLPGITGWAQVKGRAEIPWEQRVELDGWYVAHRSARLDLLIIAKTVWLVSTFRGLAPTPPGGGEASARARRAPHLVEEASDEARPRPDRRTSRDRPRPCARCRPGGARSWMRHRGGRRCP